jgi:phenylacetate-coenzyme A ligase PaaK-like adenylate-forming protein
MLTETPVATATAVLDAMRAELPDLAIGLDEWTVRMMRWHFSYATGAPFWVSMRDTLPFDPLRDITCFADLRRFGLFDKQRLRRTPVRDLLPRGFADRPFRVFETGGTTGAPCRIVNVTRLGDDVVMYGAMLRHRGLAGGDVIAMTPGGPHAYGHFVEGLADSWQGAVGAIDFDPRWVKQEIRAGARADGYIDHLVGQTGALLDRREASLLFTTSKLLLAMAVGLDEPLSDYGIRGVCTGGTSCSPEEARYLREEFLDGVQWIDTYGNTLVGHALQADIPGRDPVRSYHLVPPFGVLRVADDADWTADVATGTRGHVVATTLLSDLFIPNLLERDTALLMPPHPWFPWAGLADVRTVPSAQDQQLTEGVY